MVREVFPHNLWYLGDKASLPIMVDPKRRYQDLRMKQYWRNRDGQVRHAETYRGSTTYIMHVAGKLRYLSMRQRARRVKLVLDWVVHGQPMQLMGVDSSGRCQICMEQDVWMQILHGNTETANVEQWHTDDNSWTHSTDRTGIQWTGGSAPLPNAINAGTL